MIEKKLCGSKISSASNIKNLGRCCRGQLQISFGMIFSIILIIAFVGVAIYAITTFLSIGKCGQIGLYYNDLQDEVNKAWQSEISRSVFKSSVPGGIEQVCFGNLTQAVRLDSREEYSFLVRYTNSKGNLFMFPPNKACDDQLSSTNIEHALTDEFFCVAKQEGEVEVRLIKEEGENEVRFAR